jgi:hypothetical protein
LGITWLNLVYNVADRFHVLPCIILDGFDHV